MDYWITFILLDKKDIGYIKTCIDNLEGFEVLGYTEGELPMNHLSINCNISVEEITSLRNYFDNVMLKSRSIDTVVYGLTVIEYCTLIRDDYPLRH